MVTERTKRVPLVLLLVLLPLVSVLSARGQEVVVKNDSVTDFSEAVIVTGFVASEKAAAWLTTPCDGDLVRVQIYWLSASGSTGQTLHDSIEIFDAGSFPTPGTRLVELLGPFMTDGALNEFLLPLPIAVDQNQTFVVSLKFLEAPPQVVGPSVVADNDGCQFGRNGIFAIPGGWTNSCSFGVSGDFVIRAVVDCGAGVDSIFDDGFESGDTSAWSGAAPPQ